MKSYYLQHVPFEGPGYIETLCRSRDISLKQTALFRGEAFPSPDQFDLLFVMGGPMSVHDSRLYPWLKAEKKFIETSIRAGKTIIGICLGAQLIADVLGAPVSRIREKEIGWFPVHKTSSPETSLEAIFPESFYALHWHGETFGIPSGAHRLAASEACENQAFVYSQNVLALQFHLESTEVSINDILINCVDDLDKGPWVQTPEEIRNPTHLSGSNSVMEKIIDGLTNP